MSPTAVLPGAGQNAATGGESHIAAVAAAATIRAMQQQQQAASAAAAAIKNIFLDQPGGDDLSGAKSGATMRFVPSAQSLSALSAALDAVTPPAMETITAPPAAADAAVQAAAVQRMLAGLGL